MTVKDLEVIYDYGYLELGVDDGEATLTATNGHQHNASFTGALNPQTGRAVLTYECKGARAGFGMPVALPSGSSRFIHLRPPISHIPTMSS